MSHLEDQKKLTNGVGWGDALKAPFVHVKDKVQSVLEGIKATPGFIKKKEKKITVKETDLLKGKDYYPPQP
jgi:hypothetical protein